MNEREKERKGKVSHNSEQVIRFLCFLTYKVVISPLGPPSEGAGELQIVNRL